MFNRKFRNQLFSLLLAAGLTLGASMPAQADDIDIYFGGTPPAGSEPLVMFSLDYRPNLGSRVCQAGECQFLVDAGVLPAQASYNFFEMLRAVLKLVMGPLENVRIGLMLNHDHKVNCEGPASENKRGCSNGGYIAMGFDLFEKGDGNGAKARFHQLLADIPVPSGGVSHSYQGKELFFELYRYLTGQKIYNGQVGYLDYSGDPNINLDKNFPAISWDTGIEAPGNKGIYRSPLDAAGDCTKIFTINPLFFVANQEDDSDLAIAQAIANGGTGAPRAKFGDMLQFLNDQDLGDGTVGSVPSIDGRQNITSYFLVDERFINQTTVGYAKAGSTNQPLPLSSDPEKLVRTIQDIFSQILSVSTTLVAASIPVNVFNRAQVVDNVYLALFQPDSIGRPYWTGNVKKLRLAGLTDGTGNIFLADALDQPAVAADGRIRFDALTFWTDPNLLPPPDPVENELAGRDGRSVARGGAGQKIPGVIAGQIGTVNASIGARQVYYEMGGVMKALDVDINVINDLTPYFNLSVPPADMITEVAWMTLYARGYDIDDIDNDGILAEARPWAMADPLHSRPLPLNYGAWGSYSETNPAIFLAVASNDGYLHMIRNTTAAGGESGEEVWAYMPKETLDVLPELRSNVPSFSHPYTVDGSPVGYLLDVDGDGTIESIDGDKAYVYVGMRRGGKSLHALDVTDPENPEFLWSLDNTTAGFSELGMSFSTPRVGTVNLGFGPHPVLIFAGGYDVNKDDRSGVGTNDAEGNALYVVDAETGALIWKAVGNGSAAANTFVHNDMTDSFPSPAAVADMDGDGFTDRVVIGDSGGKVWRVDLAGNSPASWKMTLLANLGRHSLAAPGIDDDRRFFHRPDIVPSRDGIGAFDAVLIGSGNRADPLSQGGQADDFFYMIKDRNIGIGSGTDSLLKHGMLADVTDNCLQAGSCALNLSNGWRLGFMGTGEKSLSTPLTIGGTVFFTTFLPPIGLQANQCTPSEGNGLLYAVDLQNAFAVKNYDSTDDGLDGSGIASTDSDRRTLLSSEGIPAEVVSLPPNKLLRPDLTTEDATSSTRWKTFWYNAEDTDL
ncbi:MAG: PilC/PilY family type IV pilus protein [Gammaproteobacteria bacterium]|nr:PilC/PilY family type IV pilus protein [Gammaproteobacteria bacterium]